MSKFIELSIKIKEPNSKAEPKRFFVNLDYIVSVSENNHGETILSTTDGKSYILFSGFDAKVMSLLK